MTGRTGSSHSTLKMDALWGSAALIPCTSLHCVLPAAQISALLPSGEQESSEGAKTVLQGGSFLAECWSGRKEARLSTHEQGKSRERPPWALLTAAGSAWAWWPAVCTGHPGAPWTLHLQISVAPEVLFHWLLPRDTRCGSLPGSCSSSGTCSGQWRREAARTRETRWTS